MAAVVIGGDELASGLATVKWLRAGDAGEGQQESVAFDQLAGKLQQRI